jgi:hypothetical protein
MVGSTPHPGLFASICWSFSVVGTLTQETSWAVLEKCEEMHQRLGLGMLINIWQKPKIKNDHFSQSMGLSLKIF